MWLIISLTLFYLIWNFKWKWKELETRFRLMVSVAFHCTSSKKKIRSSTYSSCLQRERFALGMVVVAGKEKKQSKKNMDINRGRQQLNLVMSTVKANVAKPEPRTQQLHAWVATKLVSCSLTSVYVTTTVVVVQTGRRIRVYLHLQQLFT